MTGNKTDFYMLCLSTLPVVGIMIALALKMSGVQFDLPSNIDSCIVHSMDNREIRVESYTQDGRMVRIWGIDGTRILVAPENVTFIQRVQESK